MWEELLRRRPDDSISKSLAYALEGLAKVYEATGRIPQAGRTLSEALAIWDRLAADHGAVVEYTVNRAEIHQRVGQLHDPALHPPRRSHGAERNILHPGDPGGPHRRRAAAATSRFASAAARALSSLGRLYRDTGKTELAESCLRRRLRGTRGRRSSRKGWAFGRTGRWLPGGASPARVMYNYLWYTEY